MRRGGDGPEKVLGDAETSQEQQGRRQICGTVRVVVFISSRQGSQRGLVAQLCNPSSIMPRLVATASGGCSGKAEANTLNYLCLLAFL
jgi:hypothetical protein